MPSPHGNLTAVELALVLQACFLGLLSRRLASVAPAEIVKFPEGIGRENKVPHRE